MYEVVYRSLSVKLEKYVSGRKPQSRLPSIRALSKDFKVNPKTMSKALRLLADRNLLEITQQGIFIASHGVPGFKCIQAFYVTKHHELRNDYFGIALQEELSQNLALQHYSMIISYLKKDQTVVDFIDQYGISPAMRNGVFFIGYIPNDRDIRMLREHNLPLVSLGAPIGTEIISSCGDDGGLGFKTNLEHLISHGHRKIAIIVDLKNLYEFRKIAEDVMTENGLLFDKKLIVHALPWEFNDGKDATSKLIESGAEFSAILCFGDQVTLAAITTCQYYKLRVPEDVAIAGSALDWLTQASPVLPTGDRPNLSELARNMLDIWNIEKTGNCKQNISRKIKPQFIIGHSCGCPNK